MDAGLPPRVSAADFIGKPFNARLIDGNTISGTVTNLWMNADGGPMVLRINDATDVPWHSVVTFDAEPGEPRVYDWGE